MARKRGSPLKAIPPLQNKVWVQVSEFGEGGGRGGGGIISIKCFQDAIKSRVAASLYDCVVRVTIPSKPEHCGTSQVLCGDA